MTKDLLGWATECRWYPQNLPSSKRRRSNKYTKNLELSLLKTVVAAKLKLLGLLSRQRQFNRQV